MPISRREVLKSSRLADKNRVRMVENQWIAMKDGIQLSARVWLLKEVLRIKRGDNDSCVWHGGRSSSLKRGDWNCTVFSSFKLTSTPDAFFIEETVRALEGERVFFERENKATVPRDLM